MLGQDEQAKMEKFTETMPTIIQTHLIVEPNWADVTKKAKNLEHIIWKYEALAIAPSSLQGAGAVPSLYLHLAQSQDQDSDNIPKPFKSTKGRGGRNQVKANRNLNNSPNHLSLPQKKRNTMKRQTIIIIMKTIEAITEATDPTETKRQWQKALQRFPRKGKGPAK